MNFKKYKHYRDVHIIRNHMLTSPDYDKKICYSQKIQLRRALIIMEVLKWDVLYEDEFWKQKVETD